MPSQLIQLLGCILITVWNIRNHVAKIPKSIFHNSSCLTVSSYQSLITSYCFCFFFNNWNMLIHFLMVFLSCVFFPSIAPSRCGKLTYDRENWKKKYKILQDNLLEHHRHQQWKKQQCRKQKMLMTQVHLLSILPDLTYTLRK